jgi:hypothetical protein
MDKRTMVWAGKMMTSYNYRLALALVFGACFLRQ